MRRAPAFWHVPTPTFFARLLAPVASVWGALAARRMERAGAKVGVPVICIGNFTAGGAGKTPTAILIARLLCEAGRRPFVLTRGYGGSLGAVPHRVDASVDDAAQVGDEPLLLARHAPVIVARDRVAGARAAVAQGADVIVMDDGLQNPALHKDLVLAVVDGGAGIGNRLCLPAGPLRAPMAAQWPRVSAVVVIGPGGPGEAVAREAESRKVPVIRAELVAEPGAAARLAGARVVAFAGIGRPEKFYASLRALGVELVDTHDFADHHAFAAGELSAVADAAQARDAVLVTTEKDVARIGAAAWAALACRKDVLPVRVHVADEGVLRGMVAAAIG